MKLVELPVVMAPVHSSLFVLPNFSDVFPILPTDIDHVLQRKVSDVINLKLFDVNLALSRNHLYLNAKTNM